MDDSYKKHLENTKKVLDEVSPSFCVAKWKQVTMHLQNGHTHSCHHPQTHVVPLEEITRNPTALHNSEYKKHQRRLMLEGVRPAECDYCWKVEDQGDSYSDRIYKSAEKWSHPYTQDIVSKPWDDNVDPSYVEVSFGNVCNFKCSYCAPHISSKWMEEIVQYGPYPTSDRFNNLDYLKRQSMMPIPNKDENPYVDAFWKWWPTMYNSLLHFRITGGEPLLNKNTFKVLDYIIANPNLGLDFSINSNMCVPEALMSSFIEKIKVIVNENKVKQFKIFTSCDAYGKQAEYIRHGLDYNAWLANIRRVLREVPGCTFTVMSTYNALSVLSYTDFLKDMLKIKLDHVTKSTRHSPMLVDIPYLRYPTHQAIFILPRFILESIKDQIKFMQENVEDTHKSPFMGFFQFEVDKLKRISDLVSGATDDTEVTQDQSDFVKFVDEHDRRRGTNFLKTFPSFSGIYHTWKNGS